MASGSSRLLGRRFLYPLYAAVAEHGLPVANYPDTAGSGTTGDTAHADRPTRYFEWQKIIHQNF